MPVNKISFDVDVGLIKVWIEKRDKRRDEVNKFFEFIERHDKNFLVLVSEHTLNLIESWENKVLVERLLDLFKKKAEKIVDPEDVIKDFSKKINLDFDKFTLKFSKEARIKHEDAISIIIYTLLGTEYFVTLNRKHLRNKYEEIRTNGWKYGLKIPEIMLPKEFLTFFSKRISP